MKKPKAIEASMVEDKGGEVCMLPTADEKTENRNRTRTETQSCDER